MDALPDILQSHLMTVRQAEAIDKIVRPPMLATMFLKNQPSSINPGKVTFVPNLNEGMKSIYDIKMDLEHMTALIERLDVYKRQGQMVAFGGHKLDAVVTPNHRMVVYPRGKMEPVIKLAKDLTVWDRIKLQARWGGEKRGEVLVETGHGRPGKLDAAVWAELLGWYVAEGCFAKNVQMPGRGYQVQICQTGAGKREYLRKLLAQTPWSWAYRANAFQTSCKWLWNEVRPLGNKYDKFVPQWVRDSEPRIIEAFVRGAVLGDGWTQRTTRTYATVSPLLADGMQELFIKLGRSASIRIGRRGRMAATVMGGISDTVDQYWVGEWTTPYGLLRDSRNKPNYGPRMYAGDVFCAAVPNGTLIVRRNGKPMIAGNCSRYIELSGLRRAIVRPPHMWRIAGQSNSFQSEYDPLK